MHSLLSKFHLVDIRTLKKLSSLFAGNYRTSFHGSGMEFHEIREYSFGDNISDIDWNTTARTNTVQVKKYEEEREVKTLFLLDVGRDMHFGMPDRTKAMIEKEVFSILSFSSAQSQDPFGACYFADRAIEYTPLEKGMKQLMALHNKLDTLMDSPIGASSLSVALSYLYSKKLKNHLLFILTDSVDISDTTLFRALCTKNDCVFIHIHHSFENDLSAKGIFHFLSDDKEYFVNTAREAERKKYREMREKEISAMKSLVLNLGGNYLYLDQTSNIYREIYVFFKNRQR